MKKVFILLIIFLTLNGCALYNNYYENEAGISEYRSNVLASMCKVDIEIGKCSEKIKSGYDLFVRIKKNTHIYFVHNAEFHNYLVAPIEKYKIEQQISEINQFIAWAELDEKTRLKTDFQLDKQSPFALYVTEDNTPYLALQNLDDYFIHNIVKYLLIDKENAKIMIKEIMAIKKSFFNDKAYN